MAQAGRRIQLATHVFMPSGHQMPAVGLGTWKSKPKEVSRAVTAALDSQYRHIDCAYAYGNEAEVAQGLADSGLRRNEVWLTSKLWNSFHHNVRAGLTETLEALNTDFLDLYLMHWPVAFGREKKGKIVKSPKDSEGNILIDPHLTEHWLRTWREMERLVQDGLVRNIGVSNFSIKKLETLLAEAHVRPAVNQVELNLTFAQPELADFAAKNDLPLQAYSPLGGTGAAHRDNEVVKRIASAYHFDPAQVILTWLRAKGHIILPKSITPQRIAMNLQEAPLTYADVEELDKEAARLPQQRTVDPSESWRVEIWDEGYRSRA